MEESRTKETGGDTGEYKLWREYGGRYHRYVPLVYTENRTSYWCSRMDSGCGLNVLNEPPVGSLAQLEALMRGPEVSSNLTVERVTAAVLIAFERIWNLFLDEESEGFRPFMDRYTSSWLHSCVKFLVFSRSL